jgi:hypothetical protein
MTEGVIMKGVMTMYAEIIPVEARNEAKLIKAAMELYPEYSKKFGVVLEVVPGHSIKLYVQLSEDRDIHEQKLKLISHGVGILKRCNVQGSVETKRLREGNAIFGL